MASRKSSEEHGVVVVEGEHDVLVALWHLQILHGLVALPAVGTHHEGALRLAGAECLVNLCHQLVPLLVIVGHGLVHELVGHPVVAVALECVGQLIPEVDEVLLCLLGGEEGVGSAASFVHGVEVVGADDVEVDDGTQMVLASPVEGVGEQRPSLGQLVTLFVPELYFIDGDAHEVEAQPLEPLEVFFLDVQAAHLATCLRLRQPVAHVGAPLDFEVVDCSRLCQAGS